jgi:endo-1,4-beta-xylanase
VSTETVNAPRLRELARRLNLDIGCCANVSALHVDPQYAVTLSRECSSLTPENALKFGPLSPLPGKYDFTEADALVAFAEQHGMSVRGHVLIWHMQLPRWLTRAKHAKRELTRILIDHVRTVVGRYAGRIAAWDVVNEAVAPDGRPRNSIWQRVIGADYVRIAFEAAHEADPHALLFYNDFGLEASPAHFEAVHELIDSLRMQSPIHGIGMQMHISMADAPRIATLAERMARLASLGLKIHVTELDVRMPMNPPPGAAQFDDQAAIYRNIFKSCISVPQCDSITLWGLTDRYSWIPHFFPGEGAALLLDLDYRQKPSYTAVAAELRRGRAQQGAG